MNDDIRLPDVKQVLSAQHELQIKKIKDLKQIILAAVLCAIEKNRRSESISVTENEYDFRDLMKNWVEEQGYKFEAESSFQYNEYHYSFTISWGD